MRGMDATFEQFQQSALADGFDEVLQRDWAPDTVLDTHTHPFAVRAVVVAGQMWLSVDGVERELTVGDTFVLDANVPHAERYGPAGASYWVARKN
jgi:mannose-6-phosphate isomerase-like protein (cupin superfamily)